MRIISCASYYGTGSSAVTDLISEYKNVYSLTNYEFRFIQDPDGISDLEFQLVQNHNRHNSGHALKRYKRLVDFYAGNKLVKKYEPFFDNRWKEISYRYIDGLTEFKYKGWWQYDLLDRGVNYYYRKLVLNKILQMTVWRKLEDRQLNVLPDEITYCSRPSEEEFLEKTREYIRELFTAANKGKMPNVMVDQIVPPSNLQRYLRYFNDIKVFVVDRDPRDIYLLEKKVWKGNVIPTESPQLFCQWYQYTRAHRKTDDMNTDNIMFIQFEDLIKYYDEMTKKIEGFLGFKGEEHVRRKQNFKPLESIKNTQIYKMYPECADEIRYIENKLKEYLYVW